ncbi:MAG TPA: RNA methyltransferase [Polyangiales bacterium]|jgi:tRNA(Leu) C34 or U34 (ribose-2'-O)-methylase TrmL|nr:RNA methyltransferase [Polyangiales bacterium]
MTDGYAAIGLYHPKNVFNVGSVLRAAGCFGAALVAVQGQRYKRASTDTMKAYRHIPLVQVDDLASVIPFDCVPVIVERVERSVPLPLFVHPERAFYVFGPEDGSLPERLLRARNVVSIPSGSLNLAAAVNVVLYDRAAKAAREVVRGEAIAELSQ